MSFLARLTLALLVALGAISARAQPAKDWCKQLVQPGSNASEAVSVTVNPATRWQPRGGTIIVALTGIQAAPTATGLIACIGWSDADLQEAKVLIRAPEASDKANTLNLGIIIPDLQDAPFSNEERIRKEGFATDFGIVPLAHLRLIAANAGGVVFDTDQTIGVTSHYLAYIVAVAVCLVAVLLIKRLTADAKSPRAPGSTGWILDMIRAQDGTASLSSLQMLLWTFVVLVSAAYVMTLSGTLINLTDGTLALLGIAGAARLTAAYKESTDAPPAPLAELAPPQWSDIVRADKTNIVDITRIQMLLFTFVSAWFVLLQVLTTFVIPDIPPGYAVLMGISNGIYVGRKLTN